MRHSSLSFGKERTLSSMLSDRKEWVASANPSVREERTLSFGVVRSAGSTAILLQYSTVTTAQECCKIPGSYRAQGLTMLATGLRGG
jgi:hypothetical protein